MVGNRGIEPRVPKAQVLQTRSVTRLGDTRILLQRVRSSPGSRCDPGRRAATFAERGQIWRMPDVSIAILTASAIPLRTGAGGRSG